MKEGEGMLTGEYNHTIDAKGRVIIPSRFREDLGEDFLVTKGLEHCLYVYPTTEWQKLETKLRALPLSDNRARSVKRFFVGSAVEGGVDKAGRVLISSSLREFASLTKEVVLVGVLDHVEIWDKAKWDEYNTFVEDNVSDMADSLREIGF